MQENQISIQISAAELQAAKDAIATLNGILGKYLIALTPVDRQTLPKMGNGSLPFVQKALDYAATNPTFVPAYIDVAELKIDIDATEALLQLERPLDQLTQNLNDTVMLCGSEAYVTALVFYKSVQQAAKMKVPGAGAIADDLKARFEGQGKKRGSLDAPKSDEPTKKPN